MLYVLDLIMLMYFLKKILCSCFIVLLIDELYYNSKIFVYMFIEIDGLRLIFFYLFFGLIKFMKFYIFMCLL